jgi:hypothetical protein
MSGSNERLYMNVFKYIKCLLFKHDTSGNEFVVKTFNSNNWIKRCNCCGAYIMHGDLGNICLSEKEALKIKKEFDEFNNYYNPLKMKF